VGFFPDFSIDTAQACFHVDGKYCLRRTALNVFVIKVIAGLARCLRTVFGSLFGLGDLPTLNMLMHVGPPRIFFIVGLFGVGGISICAQRRTNHLSNFRVRRVFHGLKMSFKAVCQFSGLSEFGRPNPGGSCKGDEGMRNRISLPVIFQSVCSSPSKDSTYLHHYACFLTPNSSSPYSLVGTDARGVILCNHSSAIVDFL
jgi:hypothetical protein